jgi:predicted glycosyltransferase
VRVLVDVGHPAHVHFFRHPIRQLQDDGHEVVVTARDKDVALALLRAFGIPHEVLGPRGAGPYREYAQRLVALVRAVRRARPDVITAVGGAFVAPAGRLTGTRSLVFTDTEHVALDRVLTYPWATRIATPYTFARTLPRAQVRYRGLHELAYLGGARTDAAAANRPDLGLSADEPYAVVRLVSWGASHDRGHRGLTADAARDAVDRLSAHGRVFVTAEGPFPDALRSHRLDAPPEAIHSVLAGARVYLGEGATMATEAGLLGTPSVYVSTLVGTMGNFEVLRAEGLVLSYREAAPAVGRAVELMRDGAAKAAWRARADAFAATHVDVPAFVRQQLMEVEGAGRLSRFAAAGEAPPRRG